MSSLSVKEFIKQSLTEICEAVEEVRKDRPYVAAQTDAHPSNHVEHVKFDLAVTLSHEKGQTDALSAEGKIKAKLVVASADADISGETTNHQTNKAETTSHISFSIPISFRYSPEADAKAKASRNSLNTRVIGY